MTIEPRIILPAVETDTTPKRKRGSQVVPLLTLRVSVGWANLNRGQNNSTGSMVGLTYRRETASVLLPVSIGGEAASVGGA